MKKSTKIILFIIIILIILSVIFGVIAQQDKSGAEINYYGLNYKIVKNLGVSFKEEIYMDNYVKFGLCFYTWKVKKQQFFIQMK